MAHWCDIPTESINYLATNNTEKQITRWMRFCKVVYVTKCNASQLGLTSDLFRSLLKNARHVNCYHHSSEDIVFWIAIILSVVIILANLCVLIIFFKNRNLYTINNIPMFSLAVADFTIGIIFLYTAIWNLLINYAKYNFDSNRHFLYHAIRSNFYLCMIFEGPGLIFMCLMASILIMGIIAFERYIAVVFTYRYDNIITRPRIVGFVICTWALSIIFGLLPIFGWNNYDSNCIMPLLLSHSYLAAWCFVCFLSAVIILYLYMHIFYVANRHRNQIHALQQSLEWNSDKCESQVEEIESSTSSGHVEKTDEIQYKHPHKKASADKIIPITGANSSCHDNNKLTVSSNRRIIAEQMNPHNATTPVETAHNSRQTKGGKSLGKGRKKEEEAKKPSMKAIKTTGSIIGSFYICWLPLLIYLLVYSHSTHFDTEYYLAVITLLNSLFNPIIYGYRQTDIRLAGLKLLRMRKD